MGLEEDWAEVRGLTQPRLEPKPVERPRVFERLREDEQEDVLAHVERVRSLAGDEAAAGAICERCGHVHWGKSTRETDEGQCGFPWRGDTDASGMWSSCGWCGCWSEPGQMQRTGKRYKR